MNLKVLKRSRHIPQVGDIFVMQPPGNHYLFGRVVNVDANPLGVGGAILIYIYNVRMLTKLPIPQLSLTDLLVPPIMTNCLPWRRGYFEHIAQYPLMEHDTLKQHCFLDDFRNCYRDEYGNRITKHDDIVGDWGLDSYRTIDDAVSTALGIPLAPD